MDMDSSSTSEVMQGLASKGISFHANPFIRLEGNGELFYFGLSVIIVAALGNNFYQIKKVLLVS